MCTRARTLELNSIAQCTRDGQRNKVRWREKSMDGLTGSSFRILIVPLSTMQNAEAWSPCGQSEEERVENECKVRNRKAGRGEGEKRRVYRRSVKVRRKRWKTQFKVQWILCTTSQHVNSYQLVEKGMKERRNPIPCKTKHKHSGEGGTIQRLTCLMIHSPSLNCCFSKASAKFNSSYLYQSKKTEEEMKKVSSLLNDVHRYI